MNYDQRVYTLKEIADELKIDKQRVYRFVKQNHISEVPCDVHKNSEEIIKELVQMRQVNHISQYRLAERSGVKQPMIYRIENGINTPNMSTVLKLLAAFGKTLYIGDLKDIELDDSKASDAEQIDRHSEDSTSE